MQYLGLDYGIVGEGEESFAELLDHLAYDKSIEKIAGLAYYHDNHLIINENRFLTNLAENPPMNISKSNHYRKFHLESDKIANIQTKRGCAFNCIYCPYQYLEGNKYRLRNIDTIIEEIKMAKKKYHTNKNFFTDSVFSYPTEFSQQLCRRLIESKVGIKWDAYINPKGITEELINLYKESGCNHVAITPDALIDKLLQVYQKGFTLDEVTNCIQLLRKAGILFNINIIIGGPGEDENTIDETLQYCDKYLNGVEILIMCGMNFHFSNILRQKINLDKIFTDIANIDLGEALLKNDFAKFQRLKYFFPQQRKNNREFLKRIFTKIIAPHRILVGCDPFSQTIVDEIMEGRINTSQYDLHSLNTNDAPKAYNV